MKKLFTFFLVSSMGMSLMAQTQIDTLAFQDFEVVPSTPTWTFTGPVIYNQGFSSASAAPASSPLGIGGSRAWETTTNSGGLVLNFDNIIIPAGYDSLRVHFNLAAMNLISTGGGPDNLDYVLVAYSTDNGANFINRLRIRGAVNDNSYWPYSATGFAQAYYQPTSEILFQPINTGPQTNLGYSNCEIVFPGNVTGIMLRITARSSSSTDTWMVDNVILTGEVLCPPTFSSITETACNSYTAPSGTIYTSSGNYTDTITNVAGCDSIISINLTINESTSSTINVSACNSYMSPSGLILTSSGNYMDTIPNLAGCDSIISIALTINNSTNSSIIVSACGSYTSPSGITLTSSGNYSDTIPNQAGCDSIIAISLTIDNLDMSVSQNGHVLASNQAGANYQWINCADNTPVAGETASSFTAQQNGSYAVVITNNSCTDTSACFAVNDMSLSSEDAYFITISPNPADEYINVSTNVSTNTFSLIITDIQGKIILNNVQVSNLGALDISTLLPGVYFVTVTVNNNIFTQKLVKR